MAYDHKMTLEYIKPFQLKGKDHNANLEEQNVIMIIEKIRKMREDQGKGIEEARTNKFIS